MRWRFWCFPSANDDILCTGPLTMASKESELFESEKWYTSDSQRNSQTCSIEAPHLSDSCGPLVRPSQMSYWLGPCFWVMQNPEHHCPPSLSSDQMYLQLVIQALSYASGIHRGHPLLSAKNPQCRVRTCPPPPLLSKETWVSEHERRRRQQRPWLLDWDGLYSREVEYYHFPLPK